MSESWKRGRSPPRRGTSRSAEPASVRFVAHRRRNRRAAADASRAGLATTEAGRISTNGRAKPSMRARRDHRRDGRGSGGVCGRLRVGARVTISAAAHRAAAHVLPRSASRSLARSAVERPSGDLIQEGVDVCFGTGMLERFVRRRPQDREKPPTGRRNARLLRAQRPSRNARRPRSLAAVIRTTECAGGGDVHGLSAGRGGGRGQLSGQLRVSAAEPCAGRCPSGLGYAVASEWMFAPELASGSSARGPRRLAVAAAGLLGLVPGGADDDGKGPGLRELRASRARPD